MRSKAVNKSKNMILAKGHVDNGRKLVAVCDAELLRKRFEGKGLQLDLTGSFYKGQQVSKEKLQQLIKDAYVVNLVGEEAIAFGVKTGLIKKENVIRIANVPHAQALITGGT